MDAKEPTKTSMVYICGGKNTKFNIIFILRSCVYIYIYIYIYIEAGSCKALHATYGLNAIQLHIF